MKRDPPEVPSAAQRAYLLLERLIVTLELAPGSLHTEQSLVERAGLGRTPVREALQRLAWEGLVEVRPRAGVAISPLNAAEWLQVIEARAGVEVVLARSAARFITGEAAAAFQEAALGMQKAVITGNVGAFLEADKALDEAIMRTSDNRYAARVAAPLQSHSRRFWFRYQNDRGLAGAAEHHILLMQAMQNGDVEGAGEAADRLMALLRDNARAALRE